MSEPILLTPAPYTPFMDPRTAGPPGLSPLEMSEWTVRHDDYDAQMAYRARLIAEHTDTVLAARSEGEDPAIELLEMLLAHLGDPRDLTLKERFCPLTAICHLVPEDFCIMTKADGADEYLLSAAILCFPSRWLLAEKLGRPMTHIHEPVPYYDEGIARRVNRIFDALHPDRPVVRCNWLLHTDPELFMPIGREGDQQRIARADPYGPIYLRTERQTLVRLPRTNAIAFGIKSSVTPIEALPLEQLAGLASAYGGHVEQDRADGNSTEDREIIAARLVEMAGQAG